jgi:hypothetical protein
MQATRCKVCHRPLSDPKSIEAGMGAICAGKQNSDNGQKEDEYKLFDFNRDCVKPFPNFIQDIKLTRLPDGRATATVPHRIKYHSPTGFEWGYAGSGPADLALNILSCFVDQDKARAWHQNFKFDFIAPMPKAGGVISNEAIRNWIAQQEEKAEENVN